MIIALLNQKGGVGKTTLALHLAGELTRQGGSVLLVDADPQGSSLDWSLRRQQNALPRLFGVIGLPRKTLHLEIPELARTVDHVIIDGPPRIVAINRSALRVTDLALVPIQPSPYDLWASEQMLCLIREALVCRPALRAAFVVNRRIGNTLMGRKLRTALLGQPLPTLPCEVRQRVIFAGSGIEGRLAGELAPRSIAAQEMATLAEEVSRSRP